MIVSSLVVGMVVDKDVVDEYIEDVEDLVGEIEDNVQELRLSNSSV